MKLKLASIALVTAISACGNSKSLPGDFTLVRWEDGQTYYLTGPGSSNQTGGGAIEGTVLEIAWNADLIAAKRHATFRGDPDGWMTINTKTKKVEGPLSEAQFAILKDNQRLKVLPASEVWNAL